MTALLVVEYWRDRFLHLAQHADDDEDEQACLEHAAILERVRERLERLRPPC